MDRRDTSERVTLVPIFYFIKNQSPAPLFLLFRKRSRSHRRTACKRAVFTPICSLPTFCARARRVESFQILSFHSDHVGAKSALLRLLFCLWQKRSHTPTRRLPLAVPKTGRRGYHRYRFCPRRQPLLAVSRTAPTRRRCPSPLKGRARLNADSSRARWHRGICKNAVLFERTAFSYAFAVSCRFGSTISMQYVSNKLVFRRIQWTSGAAPPAQGRWFITPWIRSP